MVVICSLGFLRPVEDVVTLPRLFIVEEPDPLLFYPMVVSYIFRKVPLSPPSLTSFAGEF
jgi:hypothetical protein